MFRYSIKYLNHSIKNKRLGLIAGVPDESTRKIKLFWEESRKDRQYRLRKSIGKDKYDKKQIRRDMLCK